MNFRNDTYVGNIHYWIRFQNGTHEVRETEYDNEHDKIRTVFQGHYEQCVKYIKDREIEYMESLF